MAPETGLEHTRAGIAAVRAVLASADLDTPVPACPAWNLRDLARHLGNVQRWVVGAIVEGHPDTPEVDGPADRDGLLAWYDEGAAALLGALSGADPDAPCWTFGAKPRTVRFWFRRQAHEHAVHAHDARSAVGAPVPIDARLAADGIDEVVTMFFPRQVRLGRTPALTRSLAVRVEDAGAAAAAGWVLGGDGVTPPAGRAGPAGPSRSAGSGGPDSADSGGLDAEVAGPAEALYLLLWHRTGLDDPRLTLTGDATAARHVLAAALVP
jgi:uncharacterized protein (TIGR03083 family)